METIKRILEKKRTGAVVYKEHLKHLNSIPPEKRLPMHEKALVLVPQHEARNLKEIEVLEEAIKIMETVLLDEAIMDWNARS